MAFINITINRDTKDRGVSPTSTSQNIGVDTRLARPRELRVKWRRKNRWLYFIVSAILLGASCYIGYKRYLYQPLMATDPFTPSIMSSVHFPLYYPTSLPKGYRINASSVYEPQAGVVVFRIDGPSNSKIYMSEELRPPTFNLGGFYKELDGLQTIGNSEGEIVVGWLPGGKTEVGSLAFVSTNTWVITNTNARIALGQLERMLNSLTPSS